ncbi:hypothetical protein HF324_04795 [Chitinophaga oryzae]|uniref:Lipoprotein n=1 Tax=Chitinophaga oryzae TaxID=2725414 RepID=A0AAE7D761_9BACT|nr:hypothetical protein [Chitinophaga oryzae]QJB30706.1 hypothetical protein HF329_05090 [Chitinophaga oryzae]QJB37205.1 hypothetical protein HF324_04795 [Chitinophaga oryzae]
MKKFVCFFSFLLVGCSHRKDYRVIREEKIQQLEKSNLDFFRGVFIEARIKRNDTFVVYSFYKKLDDKEFYLPNFSRYDSVRIKNAGGFNVLEYGQYFGYSTPQAAWQYTKKYSDSIVSAFEKIDMYSVFGSNDGLLVFNFDDKTYLVYMPDESKVTNEFWKEKIQIIDSIKPGWYFGEDE